MVIRLIPIIMSTRRVAMNRQEPTPASEMRMKPHSNSTAPPCTTKRFNSDATTTMNMSGASDFAALTRGMRESR